MAKILENSNISWLTIKLFGKTGDNIYISPLFVRIAQPNLNKFWGLSAKKQKLTGSWAPKQ